ncbi:MAG: HAD-IIIC family phosphatase [Proteobacteria bacterium]|nr:HAD-IIIC family phosphatase [Pseudomonadota bacterium]
MKSMKYTEILKSNRELKTQLRGEKYQIVLLSNIVVNQLKEVLEFALRQMGINADVSIGEYDNIVQDSSRYVQADAVVVFWEAGNLVEGLHSTITLYNSHSIVALADRFESEIEIVLKNLRHVPLVLVNSFSSLLFGTDELRSGALKLLCKRLNEALENRATPNQLIVDLTAILARVGLGAAADFRQFLTSKALYSVDFFKMYAEVVKGSFCSVTGRARKVLVLDCDNTLWAGILGEDGEEGIQMDTTSYKGRVFREVQQILKGFRRKGILLALCSKNNSEDVERILATHPDIVLAEEDLVAKKVNWNNKAANIRELADELNLGTDSFVFVDDSSFEIGLVEKELPQVKCIQVPEILSEYPAKMREVERDFFLLSQTAEDGLKTEQYHQEHLRKSHGVKFDTINDYLTSLGLNVNIIFGKGIPIHRVSQMTQKTNQFNLTTRRYTEGDIQRMLKTPDCWIYVFSVEDRYGDYGHTGMAIIEKEQDELHTARISSLLMSCRVIGRNVEYAFFDRLVERLSQAGIKTLRAEYIRTAKNEQVSLFYNELGFNVVTSNDTQSNYDIKLDTYQYRNISYINVTEKDN